MSSSKNASKLPEARIAGSSWARFIAVSKAVWCRFPKVVLYFGLAAGLGIFVAKDREVNARNEAWRHVRNAQCIAAKGTTGKLDSIEHIVRDTDGLRAYVLDPATKNLKEYSFPSSRCTFAFKADVPDDARPWLAWSSRYADVNTWQCIIDVQLHVRSVRDIE